jgi:flavin-dependent dehydrogenase
MIRKRNYDAIVVGARAAGAATAMLLARMGLDVLAVDRSRYGSDTLSTHALMRGGVLQLHRWGLLDEVRASGAPPITRAVFQYTDEQTVVEIKPAGGIEALYAPRRTVLDRILVDAARRAGAEVEFGILVDDLTRDASGRVNGITGQDSHGGGLSLRAPLVIGADGIRSTVALAVGAPMTREAGAGGAVIYGYFRGVEASGYEWVYGSRVSAGVIPTNDGEVCLFVSGSRETVYDQLHAGLGERFHSLLAQASPSLASRVARGEMAGRFRGFAGIRGYYRKPWGNGWALVGDSGYFRDPITTHGISDAFRDAELLARAVSGQSSLAEYERIRDEVSSELFEATEAIARYDWSMDELRGHLRNVSRAMRRELDLMTGWAPPKAA